MSSRGEKGGIKKPGKSPRETLKAHDGPQMDELKARIQSLESQLHSLNDQSDTLLSTEQDIRNRIRETRSQQEKCTREKDIIIEHKRRLAEEFEKSYQGKIEEMEAALISQAVEKDLCEDAIEKMESELNTRLDAMRKELSVLKSEEQDAVDRMNSMLANIKSKLDYLNLTVTQFA